MSNLIPEQRVDRNGKTVTRHVKPKTGTPLRGNIAPPKLGSNYSLRQLKLDLAIALQMPDEEFKKMSEPERLEGMLELTRLHDVSFAASILLDGMASIRKDSDFSACLGILGRNYTIADQILAQHPSKSADYRTYAPELVTALNLYEFEMTPEDEAVLISASCRLWIDDALNDGNYFGELFPSDSRMKRGNYKAIGNVVLRDDLARYIIANPDKTESIVSIATARKLSNPQAIQGLLDGTVASPLISGVL